ncbi:MAG: tRNA pseudouridine(55) synthase TruB [Candidatus Cloacimonetes bacterium]|nr:tRNA pseudouridine(55) synthase TruB [Candidatus Cloacimonadota bacterium]
MNGFLLIDKPAGISSFDVIRSLRKISGMRKIGHAGTLDPFATGLLICAFGQYTRLLKYAEALDKSYEATLLLGKRSSTGDPEGEIIEEQDFTIGQVDIESLKARALSLEKLPLPIYSAIKIKGKRAYQYAREGQVLQMPDREVRIYDFNILQQEGAYLSYNIRVSKGTYIRSFSEWLAQELATIGMTIALRRTAIGRLSVANAHSLEGLEDINEKLCPVQSVLARLPELHIEAIAAAAIRHGRSIPADGTNCGEYALYLDQDLVAIGESDGSQIKPRLVLE